MKVLVIASEPVSVNGIRATLGDTTDYSEIMVVDHALPRWALHIWLSECDGGMHRLELVEREAVVGLEDAREDVCRTAVEDVLGTFPADHVVLFSRSVSERRFAEAVDAAALWERFGVPVVLAD